MTTVYKVTSARRLHPSDPLHVGKFYPHVERHHPRLMQDRQDLILYLAHIHHAATRSNRPLGFCRIPMRLMTLRNWVYDYKVVFDHFFSVAQTGYNLSDKHDISIVIPKKLDYRPSSTLMYSPPPLPRSTVVSKVFVRQHLSEAIMARLIETGRFDLQAPVEWLLRMPVVNFYFEKAGKLQLRDTSVWPVPAIETWPAWLREDLFGPGIDIESAYTQFLIENLKMVYSGREHMLNTLFPDLLRLLYDKRAWRLEICEVLGLEPTVDNISIVKRICMSLANGSRISPAIMMNGISITRDIIVREITDVSPSNMIRIGERLSQVARQFLHARKTVCMHGNKNPSKKNQKTVFTSYFEWERTARYLIWEKVGRHGIMVHDAIEGIPPEYLQDIPGLIQELNIKLSAS